MRKEDGNIMKYENEITVEVDTDLNTLVRILEKNNFKLMKEYDLNDIYFINKNEKENDNLSMLNKCVLIRDVIEKNREKKILTYKYKEYNKLKEINTQGKIKVHIDDIESMKLLLEKLNFEELLRINDHMLVYATETDELAILIG